MQATAFRPLVLAGLALALGLAGCKKSDGGDGAPGATLNGGPVAAVAPPAGKAWSDVVAATPEGGMLMGNPKAPIRLLEYGSLSCPHCAKFAADGFKPLVSNYIASGKVNYEYRSFAIHSIDVPLTVLVRCADPAAFFGLVEQLYANQPAVIARAQQGEAQAQAASSLPIDKRFIALADAMGFTEFFAARGVSTDQAHACLAQPAAAEKVAKEAQTWGDTGINSTPTLLINGAKTDVNTWAEIESLLQRYGAK